MKEKELERVFKALANKRRLSILIFLKKKIGLNGVDVGGISEHIKLSYKSTSKHLSVLVGADILDREQSGLQVFYCINKEAPEIVNKILLIF